MAKTSQRSKALRRAAANLKKNAAQEPGARRVTLLRDTILTYPDLWLDVYVAGPKWEEAAFAEMFVRGKCSRAASPERADLVVFVGGMDVNPALYGAEPHSTTSFNTDIDDGDIAMYQRCYEQGIPMLGVCRGAQFLHVMNGGKLFQDVDGHNGDHLLYDVRRASTIPKISSVHHQMCRDNKDRKDFEIIATSCRSSQRWQDNNVKEVGHDRDIEAFFYKDTCCFGVQGHPEYRGYSVFTKWTMDKINELIIENPDTVLKDVGPSKFRRLRDEVLLTRTAKELA